MTKTARKPWLTLLFALPFAGVGVGFLLLSVIPSLYHWQQMSDWQEAQATVTSAELLSHPGDDSTTYEAIGDYQYRVAGTLYSGSQLGINSGADNIGDWHQQMSGKLRQGHDQQTPITIYYNPDNPAEAVVDRSLRWGLLGFKMIFVLAFGGFGVGLLWWSLKSRSKFIDTPLAGEKPWLAYKDWASPTLLSDAKNRHYVAWGLAIFWNLISTPVVFVIPQELAKGNKAALLAGVFPLAGAWLVILAIKATRRWRRIGPTPLTLDPYPGSIGGQVGGVIETHIPFRTAHQFPITLSCLYSYVSGSGKNRSRSESIKWQADGFAESEPSGGGSRLRFCFDVPADLPESQQPAEDYHLWRLNLKSEGMNVNLDRNFLLPVFSTAEQSRHIKVTSGSHPLAQEKREAQIESVMDMRQVPAGLELNFPRWRNAGPKISGTIFGLLFFGAGMLAGSFGAPLLFPIIFGLIGGAMVLGGLYYLFNSLAVVIGRDGIHSQRKLLGLTIGQYRAEAAAVQELRIHRSGSMSSGNEHQVFYSVKAHLNNGNSITVAESLIGQQAAEQAAEAIALYSGFACNKDIVEPGKAFAARKKAYQNRDRP
jgi:hypothetical protein